MQVGEQFVVERYSHVMHIVSEVTGRLREGLGYIDVLRATFPAGTVSGAPKIRALEIIRELEPVKRNVYSGAVGYIGWHGDADTAIAIRTAVIQGGRLYVQAGAGIVHDSDPQKEWEETMSKGRALFRAVAEAARGCKDAAGQPRMGRGCVVSHAVTVDGSNKGVVAMKSRIFVLVLLCLCACTVHAQVNALPQARHILVYGEAQARAIPDRFKIEMTFSTTDKTADVARQKVEKNLHDAIEQLKSATVPESEIVATSLQIEPSNEYDQVQQKQVFKGIQVTRKLSARFSDQASLKQFLAGLATSEEVQVSGVTTELSSEPELKKQLRQKAIESTREKAEVIARAYGVRLAGLYSVSDTAPQFEYGITEGDWPARYQWRSAGGANTLDRIQVTGSRMSAADLESFQTGYVDFQDRIYAVFLLAD